MGEPSGFSWRERKSGDILVEHHGRVGTVLHGAKATDFLDEMAGISPEDEQQLMARLTGNYKRGNERQARSHPRNRRQG